MGLASSQARLLTLTSRMHQIEYKVAKLEAQKLQMANESRQVYEDYLIALDSSKIQFKFITTDGSVDYKDITNYNDMLSAGYALNFRGNVYDGTVGWRDANGNNLVAVKMSDEEAKAKLGAAYTEGETYYDVKLGTSSSIIDSTEYAKINGQPAGTDVELTTVDNQTISLTSLAMNYAQLCADAFKADVNTPPANVSEVITNLINSGEVTIVQKRKDDTFAKEHEMDYVNFETSVATNTGLREVTDEVALKKAEAKYEADMKKIDMKDRKFDTELAAMETERNAIKQEMETLKTVAKDNVERTFKLFG